MLGVSEDTVASWDSCKYVTQNTDEEQWCVPKSVTIGEKWRNH